MEIYVQKDGQRQGPYSEGQIRTGVDRGEFKPDDPAWAMGETSWQTLAALISLDVHQPPPLNKQPTSPKKADIPKTVSTTPPPRTRGDTVRVTIALSAVGFAVCLLLAFAWQNWSSDHIDAKTWAVFNERQGYQQSQSDPRSHAATMRGNENAFIAKYGKPSKVAHGAQPPATDDLIFRNGDLVFEVSFWYGSAHAVLVWRWDSNALTDQDIEKGLAAFADGEEWDHQKRSETNGKDIWKRIGVVAFVADVRSKAENPTEFTPINSLHIVTEEFLIKSNEKR